MKEKVKATARVTVKLEVNLTQPWPQEATIEEIKRRADEEAKNIISQHFAKLSCITMRKETKIDIIILSDE
jgi:hypothetical protein